MRIYAKKKDLENIDKQANHTRYNPSADKGLCLYQVKERTNQGLVNLPVQPPSKTVKQIVYTNVFTYFNLIFIVLALLIIIVGSYQNLVFMGVIIVNTVIGIVQEIKAKNTIDKLTVLSTPSANVIRDGKLQKIATDKLVLDDIVEFNPGNQICADAIVLDGKVEVNESLITGESNAIEKSKGDTLLSGSFIASGKCRAKLDKIGADSFASKLTLEAKRHKRIQSEMMKALNRLIKVIGIIIIPFGILMYLNQKAIPGMTPNYAVVTTVASLTGMIPEGLYLLVSVALAVSVIKLAANKTLVHELYCIETLARVDVLCLDKTGTITTGEMQVGDVILLDEENYKKEKVEKYISAFYNASEDNNETARALKAKFKAPVKWQVKKIIPFSSSRKWSAVEFAEKDTIIIGAPEFILHERYENTCKNIAEEHLKNGDRVLLLAKSKESLSENKINSQVEPIALILVRDKIRKGAKETLEYFYKQDVNIKIISGDNPVTVSKIAKRAGVKNSEKYINSEELKTQEDINKAVDKYTIFGRVTPNQKRMIIKALKAKGHTVAMTGDGVNDVLALKDADCSIAMASGSDAACQVSNLVLLDSNFSSMPKVVLEGRRVINNIERSASLFLVKTIYSAIFTLLSIFFTLVYPFVPIQLSLISALTIGAPAFFLALEPNLARVKGKFLSNVFSKALPGGITNLISMVGISIVCTKFGYSANTISTIATIVISFTSFLFLINVCKPMDIKRAIMCLVMIIAFVMAMVIMPNFFMLVPLNLGAAVVTITFVLISVFVLKNMLDLCSKVFKYSK